MKPRLILSLLFTATVAAWGQVTPDAASGPTQPITKGQTIFASHHSLYSAIPPILTEVAKAGGYPDQVTVGDDMIGGSKAIQHWDIPDATNQAKIALTGGKLDVLNLTVLYLPDDGVEKFAQIGFAHNPNVRILMMEPWLPWDVYNPTTYVGDYKPIPGEPAFMPRPAKVDHNAATVDGLLKMHDYFFRAWDAKVSAINAELGKQVVFVVPAGQAEIALRGKIIAGQAPGLKTQESLFADELGHPQPALQVLEAYCWYATIYRKSPVGLPVPSTLATAGLPADQVGPLNTLLQQLAWDAVTHHPLSGVRAQ
jgi:hypothetical protein